MHPIIRFVLAATVALAVAAAVIWGAWALDESGPGQHTRVVGDGDDETFVVRIEDEPGETFVVQCNEERYLKAHSLFRDHIDVDTVPLAVPGGSMAIAKLPADLPESLAPARRTLVEFLERHCPKKLVLVAHEDCLLYDAIAAWQDRSDEVRGRQEEDLRAAVRVIHSWLPKTEVECWYAGRKGEELEFRRFRLDDATDAKESGR